MYINQYVDVTRGAAAYTAKLLAFKMFKKIKLSIRMEKISNLNDSECSIPVGARWFMEEYPTLLIYWKYCNDIYGLARMSANLYDLADS